MLHLCFLVLNFMFTPIWAYTHEREKKSTYAIIAEEKKGWQLATCINYLLSFLIIGGAQSDDDEDAHDDDDSSGYDSSGDSDPEKHPKENNEDEEGEDEEDNEWCKWGLNICDA